MTVTTTFILASPEDPPKAYNMSDQSRNKKTDWISTLSLKTTRLGAIRPTANNLKQLISHHPALVGAIRFDEFAGRIIATRPISGAGVGRYPRPWDDRDSADLQIMLDADVDIEPTSIDAIDRAVDAVAREPQNRGNDIVSALIDLAEDATVRDDAPFRRILAAMHVDEPGGIAAAMLRRWMTGAAARAIEPGVKFDSMLILVGARHGSGKSTFCHDLVASIASPRYFADSPASISSKEAIILMRDAWVWEWSELDNINGATLERVKAFLSSAVDEYREPYGRRCVQAPRHTAVIGTTNHDDILRDSTGSRRFWVVKTCARGQAKFSPISAEMIRAAWAVAAADVIEYLDGDRSEMPPWVMPADEEHAAADIAQEVTVADPWVELIVAKIDGSDIDDIRHGFAPETIYDWLGIAPADQTLSTSQRVGRAMAAIGYRLRGQRCRGSARYVSALRDDCSRR